MSILRVWAPKPSNVAIKVGDHQLAMRREAGGWWSLDSELLAHGTDYGFILDGAAEPLPDPRAQSQPHGVHGLSRLVDHSLFRWSDYQWKAPPLSSAIIYELHIGTFTSAGTFDAAIERLSYLCDLGITHVELMPVAEFSGERGWGYDGVDLYAPHHAYGGPDALKRLVDACHVRGLAVILDVVYNHFGPSGNYLSQFGPYQTGHYHTPWGDAVNFDQAGSDEVRRFLCGSATMWFADYHIDALRIDAIHAIIDTSAVHFLEQLSTETAALSARLGRNLVLIAESDLNDPRIIRPVESGGYGMDAQWSDDFHHALHAYLTGERSGYYADFGKLEDIAKALRNAYVYDGRYSSFRRRHHGRPPLGLSGHRFLGYSQDHDQVGNRATGERSSMLMSIGRLKIAAALVLMAPFVPMLFQGEEWGASTPFLYFSGHPEVELGHAVSEGRKREFAAFGWKPDDIPDPQAPETFARSKLEWSEVTHDWHAEILRWYRELIRLRRHSPDLNDGSLEKVEVQFDENSHWMRIQRGTTQIFTNFGAAPLHLEHFFDPRTRLVLASDSRATLSEGFIDLPGESVAIISD